MKICESWLKAKPNETEITISDKSLEDIRELLQIVSQDLREVNNTLERVAVILEKIGRTKGIDIMRIFEEPSAENKYLIQFLHDAQEEQIQ